MAMADSNGDGNSNGRQQRQRPTAIAMAMATETATAIAMATAMVKPMMTLLLEGLTQGRVSSSCASDVQRCGRGNALSPPTGHKKVCIAQCCAMGVPLQRVFAPFQGGGILRSHHGLFFLYFYNYCSVY